MHYIVTPLPPPLCYTMYKTFCKIALYLDEANCVEEAATRLTLKCVARHYNYILNCSLLQKKVPGAV